MWRIQKPTLQIICEKNDSIWSRYDDVGVANVTDVLCYLLKYNRYFEVE